MKTVTITGVNTFKEISDTNWNSDTLTIVFPNATTNIEKWTVYGSAAYPVTLSRTGSSGSFTLNYTGTSNISSDYINVSNGAGLPSNTWYLGPNSVNGVNTSGFIFTYGAVRYWVGGTGTWDHQSATNWAYQSGGFAGAPAPTNLDDVYFDNNSSSGAFTVTLDSGFVGTGSISGTTLTITAVTKGTLAVGKNIYYNLSNVFAPDADLSNITIQSILTGTGGVGTYRISTSFSNVTSRAIYSDIPRCRDRASPTTNSLSFVGSSPIIISGSIEDSFSVNSAGYSSVIILNSGYNCRLGAAASLARYFLTGSNNRTLISSLSASMVFVYSGGFNTSNLSVTLSNFLSAGGSLTRNIDLTYSEIFLRDVYNYLNIVSSANLTFSSINSTIYLNFYSGHETAGFLTNNLQYGNIIFRPAPAGSSYAIVYFTGNLYCRNLNIESIQGSTNAQVNVCFNSGASSSLPVYVNVSEKFTLRGSSALARKTLVGSCGELSASFNKPSKIYITASQYDIDFVDFRDAEFTNTVISGQSIGNLGNNAGIQFTPPKTVYWKNTSTSYAVWKSASYALTEDGVGSFDNYPLAQDTVIFTDAGIGASASIGFLNPYDGLAGNIDMSRLTKPLTFNWTAFTGGGGYKGIYGDFILSNSVTINSNTPIAFYNRKNSIIDTKGKIANGYFFNSENCTLTIQSPLVTSGAVTLVRGNLSMLADITCDTFSSSAVFLRSVDFGSNFINVTGFNKDVVSSTSSGTGWSCSGTKMFVLQGSPTSGIRNVGGIASSNATQDQVYSFKVAGGSDTVRTINLSRFNSIIFEDEFTGSNGILWNYIFGDLRFSGNMTITPTPSGSAHDLYFVGSKQQNLTTNGVNVPRTCIIAKDTGSNVVLQDDVNFIQHLNNSQKVQLQSGTLNLNGRKLTTVSFSSETSSLKSVNFANGSLVVSGSSFSNTSTALTITGPGTISMTSNAAKTFAGGGYQSYPTLNQGGAGTLTITGANGFQAITDTDSQSTIVFPSNSTTRVNDFRLRGEPGKILSLQSSVSGQRATLTYSGISSGPILTSYASIKDISVTGAQWNSPVNYGCVDAGNNVGWNFGNVSLKRDFSPFMAVPIPIGAN
jgi:hypothetical protein